MFEAKSSTLTIRFASKERATLFKHWLESGGEQDFLAMCEVEGRPEFDFRNPGGDVIDATREAHR